MSTATSPPQHTSTAAILPTSPARTPKVVPLWAVATVFWAIYLLVFAAHRLHIGDIGQLTTFGVIFASIMIEAMPFILLGALVSAAMAVYVPDSVFARIARLPRRLQLPGATLAGFTFPVCECGSVPIGRRLIDRGIHPSAALGFMLAAPILNPIVLISTWVAYGGGTRGAEMVAGRAGLGFAVAMAAGFFIAEGGRELLRRRNEQAEFAEHEHACHAGSPAQSFLGHMTGDLLFMSRYLMVGAALSALMQTVLPENLLSSLAGALLIGTLALMAFAFILSLCSEADAFVATSFTAFPLGAQLAFLVFGPIFDAKLAAIYGATFRRPFIRRLLIVSVPMIVAGTVAFEGLVA